MNLLDLDIESFHEVKILGARYAQVSRGHWRSRVTSLVFETHQLRDIARRANATIKPVVKYRWTE